MSINRKRNNSKNKTPNSTEEFGTDATTASAVNKQADKADTPTPSIELADSSAEESDTTEAQETAIEVAEATESTASNKEIPSATSERQKVKGSIAGSTWIALIAGCVLLILLLVFILQNQQAAELNFFAWSFAFPTGVGFLLAAIAGALIMALVGGVRMLELRRQVKHRSHG